MNGLWYEDEWQSVSETLSQLLSGKLSAVELQLHQEIKQTDGVGHAGWMCDVRLQAMCVYLAVEPIRVLWGATGVTVFAPSEVSAAANTSVYQNWRVSFITEERITTLKTPSLLSTHDPTGDVIGWARDRRWEAGGSSNQLLSIIFTYTWTV